MESTTRIEVAGKLPSLCAPNSISPQLRSALDRSLAVQVHDGVVMVIDQDRAPNAAVRHGLEVYAKGLEQALQPAHADEARAMIGKLMAVKPARESDEASVTLHLSLCVAAVREFPLWAIASACGHLLRHSRFRPSPDEFFAEANKGVAWARLDLHRVRALLSARIVRKNAGGVDERAKLVAAMRERFRLLGAAGATTTEEAASPHDGLSP